MAEFEEKLNSILSNPDAMRQIMSFAQSLEGSADVGATSAQETAEKAADAQSGSDAGSRSSSALFDDFDPRLLGELVHVMQGSAHTDANKNAALLAALRPFLKAERQVKLEQAMKLARLSQAIQLMLGLLKGGEDTV